MRKVDGSNLFLGGAVDAGTFSYVCMEILVVLLRHFCDTKKQYSKLYFANDLFQKKRKNIFKNYLDVSYWDSIFSSGYP